MPQRRHTFSHYHLDFTPVLCPVKPVNDISENRRSGWYAPKDMKSLPAPIKTLLADLDKLPNYNT